MAMAVVASPATPAVGRAPAMFELADASPSCATLLSTLQRPPTHHPHVQPPASPLAAAPRATPPPQSAHAARGDQQHNGTAARLNDQLHSIQPQSKLGLGAANGEGAACFDAAISGEVGLRSRLQGYALRVGGMMQPSGEALGDATWAERTSNVLTSLPFLAIGVHMHRQRLTPEGRHHALSMVAVGAAATLYHASSGRARRFTRKLDYWTIAYTSSAMTKLLFSDTPGARRAANMSLLALPFRPFAVSAGHALVMQAEFARQATQHKAVRVDLRRHYTAALLGVAAFFGEDLITDSGYAGFVHSAWHCMAAYSMYTVNGLLVHKERQLLHRQLTGPPGSSGVAGGARPLRRPVHSSASSLPSYGTTPKAAAGTGWRTGTISP